MGETQDRFLALFLANFTKELIKNSSDKMVLLEAILKKEEKERKKEISHRIKNMEKPAEIKLPKPSLTKKIRYIPRIKPNVSLSIPRPIFQPRYTKPGSNPAETGIDLGKLNAIIKDPKIESIECNGPDKNLVIKGAGSMKTISISLTNEEIDEIINQFSMTAKIPVQEGVFRVAVGKLVMSAIVSNIIGSKFIITRMTYSPNFYAKPSQINAGNTKNF